jgi:hypothetical protein
MKTREELANDVCEALRDKWIAEAENRESDALDFRKAVIAAMNAWIAVVEPAQTTPVWIIKSMRQRRKEEGWE